jgi:nitrate reductase cytochrome c-type subunit
MQKSSITTFYHVHIGFKLICPTAFLNVGKTIISDISFRHFFCKNANGSICCI